MWWIDRVEVSGGFLPGLQLSLPRGLTCIIGPRGSGKSTLAEMIRFTLRGLNGAPRTRQDLLQANLGAGGLVTVAARTESGTYSVRRALKQSVVLIGPDSRPVISVDLDRGTFLPLDAYTGLEIEAIADETLGDKRRMLLDELREDELRTIKLSLSEHRRSLEANADQLRSVKAAISDAKEQIEEIGDAQAQLATLDPAPDTASSLNFVAATRQDHSNKKEVQRIQSVNAMLESVVAQMTRAEESLHDQSAINLVEANSRNKDIVASFQEKISAHSKAASGLIERARAELSEALNALQGLRSSLQPIHSQQAVELSQLQKENSAASELVRKRSELEAKITKLSELEQKLVAFNNELTSLSRRRKKIKADFLAERDSISGIRDVIGGTLQTEAGKNVQIRVIRNADDLAYQTVLLDGLKGGRVRGHDEILETLLRLRPEQLAQLVETNDAAGLEELTDFGEDRSRRILEAFRINLDPYKLEIVDIEDRIKIELNVSSGPDPNFKDAADLSRGQKCTALLPILLARRSSPLIIDQPEDNLDNHFIYETVVNTIRHLKSKRQMIFITHNANIPVLAEAELVVVLNSDGKIGFVERQGTVDQCRNSIIDLLEGGEEAFELRRKRYGRS